MIGKALLWALQHGLLVVLAFGVVAWAFTYKERPGK